MRNGKRYTPEQAQDLSRRKMTLEGRQCHNIALPSRLKAYRARTCNPRGEHVRTFSSVFWEGVSLKASILSVMLIESLQSPIAPVSLREATAEMQDLIKSRCRACLAGEPEVALFHGFGRGVFVMKLLSRTANCLRFGDAEGAVIAENCKFEVCVVCGHSTLALDRYQQHSE